MTAHSMLWQDGMFMWPHHMQQEMRFHAEQVALNHRWAIHHNWGIRSLDLDDDALQSGRLVIRSLQARFKDGTAVEIPAEGRLPFLELDEVAQGHDEVTIFLALPRLQTHRANTTPARSTEDANGLNTRYLEQVELLFDENTGEDPQEIPLRSPNVKLLAFVQPEQAREDVGYEFLPLMRFARQEEAGENRLRLDPKYIPPLLACDAWKPLLVDVLQFLFHRHTSLKERLANRVLTRGITFETQNPGDNVLLGQLRVLNEAVAVLNVLAFAEGIHPLLAYIELCRIVGQLAVFPPPGMTTPGRAPQLPPYNHDDLYTCFSEVKRYLTLFEPPEEIWEEREFVGEKLRMQVTMEAKWLAPAWQMFVGVQSPLAQTEVIRLLTKSGQLDMKIGSGPNVDAIFRGGRKGLEFTPVPQPPRILPSREGLTYFQIKRDSQQSEWTEVQNSLILAIRLDTNRIVLNPQGDLQGQRLLTLRIAGQAPTTMQFVLYLVPSIESS
jgi:type VI secretion system protein ImpJ